MAVCSACGCALPSFSGGVSAKIPSGQVRYVPPHLVPYIQHTYIHTLVSVNILCRVE